MNVPYLWKYPLQLLWLFPTCGNTLCNCYGCTLPVEIHSAIVVNVPYLWKYPLQLLQLFPTCGNTLYNCYGFSLPVGIPSVIVMDAPNLWKYPLQLLGLFPACGNTLYNCYGCSPPTCRNTLCNFYGCTQPVELPSVIVMTVPCQWKNPLQLLWLISWSLPKEIASALILAVLYQFYANMLCNCYHSFLPVEIPSTIVMAVPYLWKYPLQCF